MSQDDWPAATNPPTASGFSRLERTLLGDQIVDLLRERIISGRLRPGTPLVERELAQQLGVSRIPVRDALMQLEAEGLVVSKANGRCVIDLTERDIRELYQVRLVLEKLAVRLAAQNACNDTCEAMTCKLREMHDAIGNDNAEVYSRSDLEIHRLIWQHSGNAHLVRILNSMVGPIFMLVARHSAHYDWMETLQLHEDLVARIMAGEADAAEASMMRHTENARERSLRLFARGLL